MTQAFAKKYDAVEFDPNDPNEALAERARRAVLSAYNAAICDDDDKAPDHMAYLTGGLLVGVVQVLQASATGDTKDNLDAAIRAAIIQTAAWAVDTSRAMQGRDPLGEG